MIPARFRKGWDWLDHLWFAPTDPQVYAVLRIGFSVVALLNLLNLWPHRHAFFSDTGLIDLAATRSQTEGGAYFSVFYLGDSPPMVTTVMVIAGLAMILLGLGILPRVMIALIFVFHLSYSYRAFPIIHGWDIMLRISSFFLLVSPLGDRRNGSRRVPRYGLVLFQVQLAVIYWQTVWLKLNDAFWRNGEFISYFMLSIYSRIPRAFWADQILLSNVLTFGTLAVEIAVPFLLWKERTRIWGFFIGWGLHIGIALFSEIWVFSLVTMMMYLAFLTGRDLTRIQSALGKKAHSFA